jgi:pimeloyl-ACP methyl ester carboxylesterase
MSIEFIKQNDFYLAYETFGKKEHPPILLIQGCGAQGILWPVQFCKELAHIGYYVIRYDHRDTGQSFYTDYSKNPYQLEDLMEDTKLILDTLQLKKAHLIGSSMGGYIAQLFGIHYPERVLTLNLMMTSLLSISLEHALLENNNSSPLPLPTQQFVSSLLEIGPVPQTKEGLKNYMLSIWSVYNGKGIPFNIVLWDLLAKTWIARSENLSASANHKFAVSASYFNRENELKKLQVPTLIIHGSEDPFFPIEHAYALQKVIPSSSLMIVEKMGHLFHEAFIPPVIKTLLPYLQKHDF